MKRLLTLVLCLTFSIPALAQFKIHLPELPKQQPQVLALPGEKPTALTVRNQFIIPSLQALAHPVPQPLFAPLPPALSAPQPHVTLLVDQKTAPRLPVTVEMARYPKPHAQATQLHTRLVSDSSGIITLPRLLPGDYSIYISSKYHLGGRLYLSIPPSTRSPLYSEFLNDHHLTARNVARPARSLFVNLSSDTSDTPDALLTTHITHRLAFSGTVCDPAGFFVPYVVIDIYTIRKSQDPRTAEIKANRQGKFSIHLPNGNYLATFEFRGFETRILHVVLAKSASSRPLKVALHVPGITQ